MILRATLPILATLFLNGVNIDGVRGQQFEKCRSVRVDEKGDIYLDCPGYQVEAPTANPAAAAPSTGGLAKQNWLVTEQKDGPLAQYDLDVFINSKWVRKVKAVDDQIVMDITKLLQPGPNKVLIAATKHLEEGRKSVSPAAFIKVIVGEGQAGGGNVMIDAPLLEYKRTAAETDNINEEFTVNAK
jgi:hypothetical protein